MIRNSNRNYYQKIAKWNYEKTYQLQILTYMLIFVTQAYDWRFDGNIFKYAISNDTELLESIERIAI